MESLKTRIKSPSFWLSILGGLGTIAAGLTDTGNPSLIAIGAVLLTVHSIGEYVVDGFKIISPMSNGVSAIEHKAAALIPIVSEQVTNVQDMIKKVDDSIKIAAYRAKGYEVTPHQPETKIIQPSATQTTTATVGGEHQVVGVPKP